MFQRIPMWFVLSIGLCMLAFAIVCADGAVAADEKDESKSEANEKPAEDRFAVPEGGVKELLGFIQRTLKFQPTSRDEVREWRTKGFDAMKQAAEKITEIATDADKELPGYSEVEALRLYFRAQEVSADTPVERAALVNDIKKYFAAHDEPSRYAVSAARQTARALEYSRNPQDAIPVYRELGAALASSDDAQTARIGLTMEGAARRLDLLGKPMEITGTELDGSKFDLKSLHGKVVLVDFWATWCGPCLRELPNVKKNYELYHDKGFEVVGISLDDDRAALEKFVAEKQNPWITLYDGGWNDNATATYYGVMGIPTVILIGQDGKVVDTRARGPKLGELLAELLGPPEESSADEDSDKAESN